MRLVPKDAVHEKYPDHMTLGEARLKLAQELESDDSNTYTPVGYKRILFFDKKGITRSMVGNFRAFAELAQATPHRRAFHTTEFITEKGDNCFALLRWPWTEFGGLIQEEVRPEDASKKMKGSKGLSGFWSLTEAGSLVLAYPKEPMLYMNIRCRYDEEQYVGYGNKISLEQAMETRILVNNQSMILDGTVGF
jgi:hypothetical protein